MIVKDPGFLIESMQLIAIGHAIVYTELGFRISDFLGEERGGIIGCSSRIGEF